MVKSARGKNLFFSAEPEKWIAESDCVFVSVNTPTKTKGVGAGKAADLSFWEGAARMIASVSKSSKIVVEKSTVPVKTAEAIGKVRPAQARCPACRAYPIIGSRYSAQLACRCKSAIVRNLRHGVCHRLGSTLAEQLSVVTMSISALRHVQTARSRALRTRRRLYIRIMMCVSLDSRCGVPIARATGTRRFSQACLQ